MANGDGRGGLLSAGGILSIIVGVFELSSGGMIAVLMKFSIPFWQPHIPFFPGFEHGFSMALIPTWLVVIGIVIAILGIIAIVGGISAIGRRSFGLSLAGAICALLPINFLGILAVIFVSLAKGEFETEN
jgi:hypothetical protein